MKTHTRLKIPPFRFIIYRGISSRAGASSAIRRSSTVVARVKDEKLLDTASSSDVQTLQKFPLSGMPNNMLVRSLYVSTISSHRMLLVPSLYLLSFLADPKRSFLFNIERNPILHGILKRTMYNQFCAGETEKETRSCVQQLKDLGFRGVILTYAKEIVFNHQTKVSHHLSNHSGDSAKNPAATDTDSNIEAWRVGTLNTVDLIDEGDILAIK